MAPAAGLSVPARGDGGARGPVSGTVTEANAVRELRHAVDLGHFPGRAPVDPA